MKRGVPFLLLSAALVVLGVWPALASRTDLADAFRRGHYDQAREILASGESDFRPGEEALWRSRLAKDPATALGLLTDGLRTRGLPDAVRIRLALDAADIEFGRGRYLESLRHLHPILDMNLESVPGEVYLRAGLSLRALGEGQRAREMLASVKPADPAFHLARYYLGDIGLENDDTALALRYFEASRTEAAGPGGSRAAAGMWRALRAEGRDDEAARLVADLQGQDPGSLAMLEIRRLLRDRQEEMQAAAEPEPADEPVAAPETDRGRYALQLGAFRDRALALEFQRRYLDAVPDLRIDSVRDDQGQFLYKVRTGSFVNPALARTEAHRLADRLDIDVIVAELSGAGN